MTEYPRSVDANPTAKCNLACEFCWGPDHNIEDGLDTQEWKDTIKQFADNGTESIVFTGGEPLVRRDIVELLKYSKEQGLRVTLSTNTLLLKRKAEVLKYIDEIGIPIDGSTPEKNEKMRVGNSRAFQSSLDAIDLVSGQYPNIDITVRTVLTKVNQNDIEAIGELVQKKQAKIHKWKIYQFAPVSIGAQNAEQFEMPNHVFYSIGEKLHQRFPDMPIQMYPSEQRSGRYVFLGPEGNVSGVDEKGEYKISGNLKKQNMGLLIQGLYNQEKNTSHAHT